MKKLFLLLVIILLLASCTTQKHCNKRFPCTGRIDTIIKTDYREVLKDTTIYLTDSAWAQMYFECSKDGDVLLKQILELKAGKYVTPRIIYKDKMLYVECKVDSVGILLHYKNILIKEFQKIDKTTVVKENYLTGWQWFQLWAGRIFLGLIILILIYLIIRNSLRVNRFFKPPK